MMMVDDMIDFKSFRYYKLTDEEIKGLSSDDVYEIGTYYESHPLPVDATVKGLLERLNIKYDDLSDFVLGLGIGICNSANRTKTQIYINRPNSEFRDNIVINLNKNSEAPPVTVQTQVGDNYVHEDGFDMEGVLLYHS